MKNRKFVKLFPIACFLLLGTMFVIDSCKKKEDPQPSSSSTTSSSSSTTSSSTTSSSTTTAGSTTSSTSSSSSSSCSPVENFYTNEGGKIGSLSVTCSNGGLTLSIDDGSEIVTATIGSLPTGTANYTIVNGSSTPGATEVAIKIHYYGGNNVEDLTYTDSGKTASVCNNGGKVTIKWNNINYKYPVETTASKSSAEMTCP